MNIFASDKGFSFFGTKQIPVTDGILANLVRSGCFARYHFFLPYHGSETTRKKIVPNNFAGIEDRIGIFRTASIPHELSCRPWSVFYSDLISGAYIRDTFASKPFACVWHIQDKDWRLDSSELVLLLLSNLQSYDVIMHSSNTVRQRLENMCRTTQEKIWRTYGKRIEFPPQFKYVKPGVDTGLFAPGDPLLAKRECQLPENRIVFLCIGEDDMVWSGEKMLPLLRILKALLQNADPDRRPCLVLCGPKIPQNREKSVKGIIKAMELENHVLLDDQHEWPLLLQASDACISFAYSTSNRYMEQVLQAMACELPVVVPDSPEYRSIIANRENGFLVPVEDIDLKEDEPSSAVEEGRNGSEHARKVTRMMDMRHLYDILASLISNQDVRISTGKKARTHAAKEFDWSCVIPQFNAICKEASEKCRSSQTVPRRSGYPGLSVANCGFFNTFHQNYTAILDETQALSTTQKGESALKGDDQPPIYGKLLSYIDTSCMGDILTGCIKGMDVQTLTREKTPMEQESTRFHVMWLLKHGYLCIMDQPGAGREDGE